MKSLAYISLSAEQLPAGHGAFCECVGHLCVRLCSLCKMGESGVCVTVSKSVWIAVFTVKGLRSRSHRGYVSTRKHSIP